MFAIVNIAGQQFKVTEGQEIFVHQLDAEEGAKMNFDDVLFVDKEGKMFLNDKEIASKDLEEKLKEAEEKGETLQQFLEKFGEEWANMDEDKMLTKLQRYQTGFQPAGPEDAPPEPAVGRPDGQGVQLRGRIPEARPAGREAGPLRLDDRLPGLVAGRLRSLRAVHGPPHLARRRHLPDR